MRNFFLIPFSIIYGMAVGFRNVCFNLHILPSRRFETIIISIGNLTVGGTGKTPHTEYIVNSLIKKYCTAVLSRGYKRKTSGFIIVDENSTVDEVGDEPLQIKRKFPKITVACDEKRVDGINKLNAMPENRPEVIVLDDAFQHRYVIPDRNIVLMDYNRPIFEDHLLPYGNLREPISALRRADYIIVTKCPVDLTAVDRRIFFKRLNLMANQHLFFSYMTYGEVQPLRDNQPSIDMASRPTILCVTGIASPQPYHDYLQSFTDRLVIKEFPDHHAFLPKDIQRIETMFSELEEENKVIFTTEKDAMRLKDIELPESIANRIYYIPVIPAFLENDSNILDEINDYIRRNKKVK